MKDMRILAGVGVAAVAGLLLGGAMKPDLRADERPEGPQIFTGWSADRSTGPFDDGWTLAYRDGQLPQYVTGSDYTPVAWREDPAAEASGFETSAFEGSVYDTPTAAFPSESWQDSVREPVLYPSMSGGVAYDASARAPASPEPVADIDADAPPEATGDTTVVAIG